MKHLVTKIAEETDRIWRSVGGGGTRGVLEAQVERLIEYGTLVHEWTDRVDLISPCTFDELITRHVLDSIGLWLVMERFGLSSEEPAMIFDIGSGAGFPGIVLAILAPAWHVTLVEPRERRCVFLNEVRRRMKIENLEVFSGRFNQLVSERRIPSPVVVVRGLTPDREFSRCAEQLSATGETRAFYLTGGLVDAPWKGGTDLPKSGVSSFSTVPGGLERRVYFWAVAQADMVG